MIDHATEFAAELKEARNAAFDEYQLVGFMIMEIEKKLRTLINYTHYFGTTERSISIDLQGMSQVLTPGFPYPGLPLEAGDILREKLKEKGFEVACQKGGRNPEDQRVVRVAVAIPHAMLHD